MQACRTTGWRRIGLEFLPAQLRQTVDAFSVVIGFHCHQNAVLGCDLDQEIISHNARLKWAKSVVVPFHSIRILPRDPSTSTTHWGAATTVGGLTSSTNVGIARALRALLRSDSATRLR